MSTIYRTTPAPAVNYDPGPMVDADAMFFRNIIHINGYNEAPLLNENQPHNLATITKCWDVAEQAAQRREDELIKKSLKGGVGFSASSAVIGGTVAAVTAIAPPISFLAGAILGTAFGITTSFVTIQSRYDDIQKARLNRLNQKIDKCWHFVVAFRDAGMHADAAALSQAQDALIVTRERFLRG